MICSHFIGHSKSYGHAYVSVGEEVEQARGRELEYLWKSPGMITVCTNWPGGRDMRNVSCCVMAIWWSNKLLCEFIC